VNIVDKALETQLTNIQARSGKSLDQLFAIIRASGLAKHGEILAMLKRDLGMGHGDANRIALTFLETVREKVAPAGEAATGDVISVLYDGSRAPLRPIHERLMAAIAVLGPVEIAPKKGYVSLRRKKQFAMAGPGTKMRVELGLNMKGVPATERLTALPPGGMCQFQVYLSDVNDVDEELAGWLKMAYDSAG
jgi:hypothetical protein